MRTDMTVLTLSDREVDSLFDQLIQTVAIEEKTLVAYDMDLLQREYEQELCAVQLSEVV